MEAMLIGFGGKILILQRLHKKETFFAAFGLGLLIVVLSIGTSLFFNLEPVYFIVLVMCFSIIVGRVVGALGRRLVGKTFSPPLPMSSDEEIKKMVAARGYGDLLERSRRRKSVKKG
ncbi:MAG: hypothetical protein ACP5PX_04365 [Candidatus Hadarchaeum sp.]|uniref:hypothetical protein n=1 Tax=Candidatus Hadarchaeum sp. TaxID=2883567 RepID=UPI003D0D79E5